MKNVCIVYQSRTGTTKRFARAIAGHFNQYLFQIKVFSIENADKDAIRLADILFLGCWTNGAFIILQKPDKEWQTFAESINNIDNKKIILFTTYKIATGTMFRNMQKHLKLKNDNILFCLKSRNGALNKSTVEKLEEISK